ncbi:MAG: Uma2 family endonuclease [Firmicutes bacterium]|nr:Uma2 family endonuclease [Bacillota bacterium]
MPTTMCHPFVQAVEDSCRRVLRILCPAHFLGYRWPRVQEALAICYVELYNGLGGDHMAEQPTHPRQGEYTYEDYLQLPEEPGYRFEILQGFLVREPSPSVCHQRILRELVRQLLSFFDDFDPAGELFFAPLDLTLTRSNVLQPDILFVSGNRQEIILQGRIDGPCDLVVEILSPTTQSRDRIYKTEIYCQAGIPHYWIVDPEENTLEAFVLKADTYALIATGKPGERFCHPDFPGMELDMDRVFHQP